MEYKSDNILKLYLWEYYIEGVHFILRRRLGERLAETQESSSEEPIGQVNLHDHVYEIQKFAKHQAVCPRTIQVQAVYKAGADLLYPLVAIFPRRYLHVVVYLELRFI